MRKSHEFLSAGITILKTFTPIVVIVSLLVILKPEAHAVPSYSRQTGLPARVNEFETSVHGI
jgi:hypothetical protein